MLIDLALTNSGNMIFSTESDFSLFKNKDPSPNSKTDPPPIEVQIVDYSVTWNDCIGKSFLICDMMILSNVLE